MKVHQIAIENFRTIEKLRVKFDGYYAAICGQNNAGKTSLIRILRNAFRDNSSEIFPYLHEAPTVNFAEDKTQWVTGDDPIRIKYTMLVDRKADPGLFGFVQKFYDGEIDDPTMILDLELTYSKEDQDRAVVFVKEKEFTNFDSTEIFKKILSSNIAFIHDSSDGKALLYSSRRSAFHEIIFSPEEKDQIEIEQKRIQKKIQKISKAHRAELSDLLGRLKDSHDVELTIPERLFGGTVPFRITLKDKNVDVPLEDWGSGTQNRTQIMMSILQANRIKIDTDENKITPMVIIEEPESFLHPSAQAEFGRVLRALANELEIQTIVTTHSPYMLCQESPSSNILLDRRIFRRKHKETFVVEVDSDRWMEPFSSVLGLDNSEFAPWQEALRSHRDAVLMVEGGQLINDTSSILIR